MKNYLLYLLLVIFLLLLLSGSTDKNNLPQGQESVAAGDSVYLFQGNRFKLPISNNGVVADVSVGGAAGGTYDNKVILFSGGFFMSGYTGNFLWTNAVASASRIEDYQKGTVLGSVNDPRNIIYVVQQADLPFSFSWIDWKDAVALGADFYDGDNDGIYNPVDLNSNGQWDPGEDKPDMLGEVTTWCVFNDKVDPALRRYNDVSPQGIEIQQTAFAGRYGELDNFVFFRYRLVNRGTAANVLDSVIFSIWADGDLGDYLDDLVGCDTLHGAGYIYNDGADNVYGGNPPAFFQSLQQGPQSYIPGVTFIDVNSNGAYDEGVDTPLDTAYSYRGNDLGIKIYPGAMNLNLSSYIHYQASDPNIGDPSNRIEARNYMLGLNKNGNKMNPCTWTLGVVHGGVNCAQINPLFWYSGDPVSDVGWINNNPTDQRQMVNTGPFKLVENQPVDIIVGYSAARGNDALSSITKGRTGLDFAKMYYNNNFVVSVDDELPAVLNDYSLQQNYPNPFNPATVIRYTVPFESNVKLTIFNTLGEKVKEAVNSVMPRGSYEYNLNSTGMSSGVYFYSLSAVSTDSRHSFISVKKMVIIK